MNEQATIREILDRTRTIAVVGLTNREGRASLGDCTWTMSSAGPSASGRGSAGTKVLLENVPRMMTGSGTSIEAPS